MPEQKLYDVTNIKGMVGICSKCLKMKNAKEFKESKTHKLLSTCRACTNDVKNKAEKARLKKFYTNRHKEYKEYLLSDDWKNKKLQYWNSPHHLKNCYICNDPWIFGDGKQLHHTTYENLFNESLNDLVPVCVGCHQAITKYWNKIKNQDGNKKNLLDATNDVRYFYAHKKLPIKNHLRKV